MAKKAKRAPRPLQTPEQASAVEKAIANVRSRAAMRQAEEARRRQARNLANRRAANDDFLAELIRRVPHAQRGRITAVCRTDAANDNPAERLTQQVQDVIRAAVGVVARMPAGKYAFPGAGGSGWPEVVNRYFEAGDHTTNSLPRDIPAGEEVERAMRVIGLLWQLTTRERKIVSARALGFSHAQIGKEFRCGRSTIRRQERLAILALTISLISHNLV